MKQVLLFFLLLVPQTCIKEHNHAHRERERKKGREREREGERQRDQDIHDIRNAVLDER
jgi:hypothetical protein